MPRLIDHAQREQVVAEACFRVLDREGLAGLSVRRVAEEAGIATASLRRAFPTQHALRLHCLHLVESRTKARIAALTSTGRSRAEDVLTELLPLDHERRLEFMAQVQLGVLALTDPDLRPVTLHLDTEVQRACRLCLETLHAAGAVHPNRDTALEEDRLHALLDGLAMSLLWSEPGHGHRSERTERILEILGHHLEDLSTPPAVL